MMIDLDRFINLQAKYNKTPIRKIAKGLPTIYLPLGIPQNHKDQSLPSKCVRTWNAGQYHKLLLNLGKQQHLWRRAPARRARVYAQPAGPAARGP